jgi:hypothetical protein
MEGEPQAQAAGGIDLGRAAAGDNEGSSMESPVLVASTKRKDQPMVSLRRWLERTLRVERGECDGLAKKLLRGSIKRQAVSGKLIKDLCSDPDPDVSRKFFSDRKVDDETAQRIRVGCMKKSSLQLPACRKRRHASDADGSGDEDGLMDSDDSANPQLLATLGSDDASAQMTDAAAGARLALPQACTGPIPPPAGGHNAPGVVSGGCAT